MHPQRTLAISEHPRESRQRSSPKNWLSKPLDEFFKFFQRRLQTTCLIAWHKFAVNSDMSPRLTDIEALIARLVAHWAR